MLKSKWFTPLTVLIAIFAIAALAYFIPELSTIFVPIGEWLMSIGLNLLLWVIGFFVPIGVCTWVFFVWCHGEKRFLVRSAYFLCGAVLSALINIGIWAARVEVPYPGNPYMQSNYIGLGLITLFFYSIIYLIIWSIVPNSKK